MPHKPTPIPSTTVTTTPPSETSTVTPTAPLVNPPPITTKYLDGYVFEARPRGAKGSIHVTIQKAGASERLGECTTKCNIMTEAMQDSVLRACLAKVLARVDARASTSEGLPPSPPAPAPKGSFEAVLETRFAQMCKTLWGDKSQTNFRSAKKFILDNLDITIRWKCIATIARQELQPVVTKLDGMKRHKGQGGGKRQKKREVERLLKELMKLGLTPECADIFKAVVVPSDFEKSGRPYTADEMRRMLILIPSQCFAVRFLFWNSFAGAAHMADCASLKITELNLLTGKAKFDRLKNGGTSEYVLVAEGLALVQERTFHADETFVVPELVHSAEELAKPPGQRAKVDVDEAATYNRISNTAGELWSGFLAAAEITDKEVSFKSMRQEATTHLLSAKAAADVVARVQGNKLPAIRKYDFAEDWQFFCARDLREQLLRRIRAGDMGDFVLTEQQLLTKMQDHVRHYLGAMQALADRRHGDLVQRVQSLVTALTGDVTQQLAEHDHEQSSQYGAQLGQLVEALNVITTMLPKWEAVLLGALGIDFDRDLLRAASCSVGRLLTEDECTLVRAGGWPTN